MQRNRVPAFGALTLATALFVALPATSYAAGATYWVDAASPSCSDTGGGSQSTPFCSISAAAKAAVNAGDTVEIAPAVYREQVSVPASGTAGAPISFIGTGPGVTVLGTSSLSDPALWTSAGDGGWTTPYAPASKPRQVFFDGVRLDVASSAGATTPGSFFFDATTGVLKVNVGGGNPGDGHQVEAGAFSYGFNVNGRSGIVIKNLDVQGENWAGIRINAASDVVVDGVSSTSSGANGILVDSSTGGVVVSNSTVTDALSVGVKLNVTTGATVSGTTSSHNGLHGIALSGSSGNTIVGNRVHHNVSLASNNTALGIDVNGGSTNNLIQGNRAWANQDSGIQVYNGSNDCVVVRNISYANGDHGFDTLKSTGVSYVSNTAVDNHKDGISVEGSSTGATLRNNVLVDNGLTTAEFNVYTDASSMAGYSANYDMVFNHAKVAPIKVDGTVYASLGDFHAATGLEGHGLAQDPDFVDQPGRDYHPTPGSPAVDSANSGVAGFVSADADGQDPLDDPIVPDTGAGSIPFADRGALEGTPVSGASNYAPHAVVVVDPTTAAVPPTATVSVDASGSGDADTHPIAWYRFFFGDGTSTPRTSDPVTSHTYSATGSYTVELRVGDTAGATTTTSTTITITDRTLVTYHVEGADPSCSDSNPGTAAQPLCTINAAMGVALAGDTVLVGPATYREQVRPKASGEAGAPITVQAAAGAVIAGTDDVSNGWSSTSTTAWKRAFTPQARTDQVFVDGAPLAHASSASAVAPGEWYYDAPSSTLTVDIGGGNPGSGHTVEAGSRNFGILARQVSDYAISGFQIRGTNYSGLYLDSTSGMQAVGVTVRRAGTYGFQIDASTDAVVSGSTASHNGSIGVRFWSCTGGAVRDSTSSWNGFHGVSVQGSDGVLVDHVVAGHNLRPGTRVATGIDVSLSSTNTTVQYSETFANDDSGIEAYTGADGTVIRRNVVYDNGDHGIDSSGATRTSVVSNTVVGNATAGINFEGGSTGGLVADNVTMDNAVGSTRTIGEIRVDESSEQGMSMDHDLVFQSADGPLFEWRSQPYYDVRSFQAASGQEPNGLSSDPMFVDLAARDLHLRSTSAAIDSADATVQGWMPRDFDGNLPGDVTSVADSGVGSPAYADRGAYEYAGPVAVATLSVTRGSPTLFVDVDGTSSTTFGSPITTYAWDCGNGDTFTGATGQCVYTQVGDYPLSLTVTDSGGLSNTQTTKIHVFDAPPTVTFSASPSSGYAPQDVVLDASGSADTDSTPISGYQFTCGTGDTNPVQTAGTFTCAYTTAGTYQAGVVVYDTAGQGTSATTNVVIHADQAPNAVLTLSDKNVRRGGSVFADGSVSTDADNTPIAAYLFDCGNGQNTGWQSAPTATCNYYLVGRYRVRMYVRDTAGLVSSDSARVRVR